MSEMVIKAEGVCKRYRLGVIGTGSLTRDVHLWWRKMQGKDNPYTKLSESTTAIKTEQSSREHWALRDINFEVNRGDALAVIGKNGAGKSTLLKVLSRVTTPTQGNIKIKGRIASLLEVGTGFHPELTGRENIFLKGAVLGMTKPEIKRQFDEIVAFSGVEKYLETPVKRYSSGMYVRLAFSVAAHLEAEILIIDEVLAVGDSAFQQKCIDKMLDVSRSGRTILFVSHNMQAARNLCNKAIQIVQGQMVRSGDVEGIVQAYLTSEIQRFEQKVDLTLLQRDKFRGRLRFSYLEFSKDIYHPGDTVAFELSLENDGGVFRDLDFSILITDSNGIDVAHLTNVFLGQLQLDYQPNKRYRFVIPDFNFKQGVYTLSLTLKANEEIQDMLLNKVAFEIAEGNIYEFNDSKLITGIYQPRYTFEVTNP